MFFQVLTSSLDGTLRIWDLDDGSAKKVIKIGLPIRHMALSPDGAKAYLTTIKVPKAGDAAAAASPVPMTPATPGKGKAGKEAKTGSQVQEMLLEAPKPVLRRLFKCRDVARLSVTLDGVLVAGARKNVFVWREGFRELIKLKHDRDIKCVAVHSEQRFVAAADERGEIFLWYNALDETDEAPVRSTQMHWHSQAVQAMCVSAEGGYLFSGGKEAVLVIWQLGSGHKSFLPRLGGPIEAVTASPDGTQLAVMCEGGKIRVVDMQTRKIVRSVRLAGMAISAPRTMDGASVLCGSSGQGLVAVCGVGGTDVEVWDVKAAVMVGSVEVLPRNFVSQRDKEREGRGERAAGRVRVSMAAFSGDGGSLAVVHGRDKSGRQGEAHCQLSMWRHSQGRWQVESRVLTPHKEGVTSLSYGPVSAKGQATLLLSSGLDGLFKVWRREARIMPSSVAGGGAARKAGQQDLTWRCQSVCGLRPVACGSAALSHDGSVVAAAYAHTLCICAYPSLGLLAAVTNTACRQPITKVQFLPQSACVVAATASSVALWDVATSGLVWSYSLAPLAIAVHPSLPLVAMSTRSGIVDGQGTGKRHALLCRADSAVPSHTWELEQGGGGALVWSKGAGGRSGGERLLAMQVRGFAALETGEGEGGGEGGKDKERGGAGARGRGEGEDASAYERMMGPKSSSSRRESPVANPLLVGTPGAGAALSLLDGPSHVLGAPSSLLLSFLSAMLPPPAAAAAARGGEEEDGGGGKNKGKKGKGGGGGEEGGGSNGGKGEKKAGRGREVHVVSTKDDDELSFALPRSLDLYAHDDDA